MICNYFLSYACVETFENGIMEFDTYAEAFDAYCNHKIAGYSVVIRDIVFNSDWAAEIRKGAGYIDRRTECVA